MATEKAVILARGLGKRMRSQEQGPGDAALSSEAENFARLGLKALIPLRGRPFLDYVVGSLMQAGIRRLCLVVAPDSRLMADYARRTSKLARIEVTCAVQEEPLGTADAVLAAEGFADGEPFIASNCDNLYPQDALNRLARLSDLCCYGVGFESQALLRGGNIAPERVKAFGIFVLTDRAEVLEIVEKPSDTRPYSREGKLWVSMNLFRFTPDIFDACRRVQPSPRGELELTSAVSLLARSGRAPFRVLFVEAPVLDLTRRDDVAAVERLLEGREAGF